MSYHDNSIVNDIILTIINDGSGQQCGMTYQQRVAAAEHGLFEYRLACRTYNRQRSQAGAPRATLKQCNEAADYLQSYYRAHAKELA